MKIALPTNEFSFYRLLTECLFFVGVLIFPAIIIFTFSISLILGRVHGVGAWVSMWRAGKLNWTYVTWMFLFSISISYWGLMIAPYFTLSLITYFLFAFHFYYDEFELQGPEQVVPSAIQSVGPFIIAILYLFAQYYKLPIGFETYLLIAVAQLCIELFFVRVINWFFVQMKVLTIFTLAAIALNITATAILGVFLIAHYIFWFVYPVYKLNKYRPAERDGFIMMMALLIATSFFYTFMYSAVNTGQAETIIFRVFMVGTIVHIISTPPFGYLFGLTKPKVYPKENAPFVQLEPKK